MEEEVDIGEGRKERGWEEGGEGEERLTADTEVEVLLRDDARVRAGDLVGRISGNGDGGGGGGGGILMQTPGELFRFF